MQYRDYLLKGLNKVVKRNKFKIRLMKSNSLADIIKIFSHMKDVSYYMKNKLKIINKKLENDELNLVIKNFDHRIK